MNLFELFATITLDTSGYEQALQRASSDFGNASDSIQADVTDITSDLQEMESATADGAESLAESTEEAAKKTKGLSKEVEDAKKNIQTGFLTATTAGAAALGAFGVASIKTGADFDSSMSQVAATMGLTMDEMMEATGHADTAFGEFEGNLREFAQFMGSNTAFSASQAADALNYMALAGYDAQTSMTMLPNVLNLAAAGGMDLATASDMITDSQSALGLSLEETSVLVDQMAKASSTTNTSVSQLGGAILQVGGTAKGMKEETLELAQVLGLLADNGVKGAEGGTALRNIILSLTAPTDKAKGALDALGVQVLDEEGNMRLLEDVFLDLNAALSDMSQGEQTEVLSTIFNKTDLKSVNALLGTSVERWEEVAVAIDGAQGSAQQMADTQLDNLEGDITLLKSAFEGLQIAVADKLMPAAREFIQFLTTLIEHINTVGPILAGLGVAFGTFAIAINITSIITKVQTAWTAFTLVLAANPIGLIVAAIAGLVTALVLLWQNNEDFRNFIIGCWEGIKEFVGGAIEAIAGFFTETLPNAVNSLVESVKAGLDNFVANVAAFADSVGEFFTVTIPEKLEALVTWFTELPDRIAYAIGFVIGKLIAWSSEVGAWVHEEIPKIIESVVNFFAELPGKIGEKLTEIIFAIIQWGAELEAKIRDGVSKAINAVVEFFAGLPAKIGEKLSQAAQKVSGWITDIGNRIRTGVPALINQIVQFFQQLPQRMLTIGKNIVTGIWNGIQNGWHELTSRVTGLFGNLVSGIKHGLGIASPSKVFASIGGFMAEGLGEGWEDEYRSVRKSITDGLSFSPVSAPVSAIPATAGAYGGSTGVLGAGGYGNSGPIQIVVQSILDGRKIGESVTTYQRGMRRAQGT